MTTRLLAIADPGCPASTRIRVTQFASYLQSKDVELQTLGWPARGPGRAKAVAELLDRVAQADAVVVQRYLPDSATIRQIRRRARRLTFDFDDAITYSESARGKSHLKLRRAWRFRQMMRCCDAVTAGNDYLAGIARRYAAGSVRTVPTTVDLKAYESAPADPAPGSEPVVGWLGLPSTFPYLETLRRPLERLLRQVPRMKIRVITSQRLNLGNVPIEWVEWSPENEARELARLRVGLAPLLDDQWTRGKCARRLTQYMAAGVPAVASPVGSQAEITEGGAALPASSDDDWVAAVRKILDDSNVAATLAERGKRFVREHFDAQVWAEPLHTIWCGSR